MSLQVWLPLHGNLNNQGLDGVVATNNGATLDDNGKIGKCYSFSGSNSISLSKVILQSNTPEWSFACWFNLANTTTSSATCLFSERTGGNEKGYTIFIYPNNSKMLVDDGVRWTVTPMTFSASTWYHLVVTRNSDGKKIYINGELKSSTSTVGSTTSINTNGCLIGMAQSSTALTTGNQGFIGKLNDVRIYDHCLSVKESKELSKGLILHYPLKDEFVEPSQNLCTSARPGTAANSTWGGHITTWTNYDASNDPVPFNEGLQGVITYGTNGSTGGGASRSVCTVAASPSTIYTYSFYIKASDDFEYTNGNFIYRYEYTAVSGGSKVKEGGLFNNSRMQSLGHGWYRCWGTYTTQDTTNAINISFYTYPSKNVTYWIGGWQIEQKDHMTPFMKPNSGRNYTVEYDCSGYGNDGTVTGTITPSSDTMRYNASYTFDGSQRISADALPAETQTISVWAKTTKNKSTAQCILGDSASGICIFIYSGGLITYFRGSAGGAGSRVTFGSEYKENDWNHLVVVKTGDTTRDVYCNGVKLATAANNYYTHAEGFWVGARNSSNQLPFYGQISDIRAFAIALSAEDVKELYQVSASVDNQGNLHTYEVVER